MNIWNEVLDLLGYVVAGALSIVLLLIILTIAATIIFTSITVFLIINSKIADMKETRKRKRLQKQVIREWREWEYTQPPQKEDHHA